MITDTDYNYLAREIRSLTNRVDQLYRAMPHRSQRWDPIIKILEHHIGYIQMAYKESGHNEYKFAADKLNFILSEIKLMDDEGNIQR